MTPGLQDLVVRGSRARFCGRHFPCKIGRSGLRRDKREGDGATPVGIFRAERVFYRPDRIAAPGTILPVRPIRHADAWSDDPADPDYNAAIRRPHQFGSESLWLAGGVYDVIIPLDYNRPSPVPGAGSAIFLHVADLLGRQTAGCIAFRMQDLLCIANHWTRDSRVVIAPQYRDSIRVEDAWHFK